jgi:putative ABC transport system permease protein
MSPARAHRFARLIVAVAAALVPSAQRHDWYSEWHGELASLGDLPVRYRRPTRRALGAFADAFWLRQRSIADFTWIDDLRIGMRQLVQHTGFALTAVGILSLGLTATVSMFSVTEQVLLRPLPYAHADRIVTLWETRAPDDAALEVAPGNLLDWRERLQSLEHVVGVAPMSLDIALGPRPEVWFAAQVTEGFFETFGLTPIAGRFFRPEEFEKGRNQVLVISESFWRRRFSAAADVIGMVVRSENGPLTIIGVAPAWFEPRLLLTASGDRDMWQPKAIEEYEPNLRGGGFWNAVGRLKPGVTVETAQAEIDAVSAQLAREYPRTNEMTGARVLPLREHLVGDVRLALQLLAGAVLLVLLIACVNIANLLLARGSAREREIAVRVALGARRGRIVQQLLIESLVIAVIGSLFGVLLTGWALSAIVQLGPPSVPWLDTLHLDWRAVAFAGVMSIVVALLAGALPAYRVSRAGLATAGRNTSTADASQHRLRVALVVVEVAVAVVLVAATGLLVRSFVGLINVDPGFQRDRVFVAQVFAYDHYPTPAHLRAFYDTTLEKLRALPSVQEVGAVSAMPFIEANINIETVFAIAGRPPVTEGEAPRSHLTVATPSYFDVMRIPLKAGRKLAATDGPDSAPVVVISESLARRYWRDERSPLGERLRFRLSGAMTEVEVVGVVGSVQHERLDRDTRDEIFIPLAQRPFGSMTFVGRAAGDASALIEPARATIWEVSPNQTIYRTATLDELVSKTVSPRRFALAVALGFAAVALLLAIAGVYGVLTAIMNARLREVGLRVALGASRWDIVRLVVGRGLLLTASGLAIGLAAALGVGRALRSFLFGITPTDPLTILASAAMITVAALLACYLPARRAAEADPVSVLRAE